MGFPSKIFLLGNRFGKVTLLYKSRKYYYKCQCDCGELAEIHQMKLRRNPNVSCGNCTQTTTKNGKSSGFNNLFAKYNFGARIRKLAFLLSEKEFEQITSSNCYYCGTRPLQESFASKSKKNPYIYNGIDRIDNSKGYISGNVVAACFMCNNAKSNYSLVEFLQWLDTIAQHRSLLKNENMLCMDEPFDSILHLRVKP